ncbi:5-hydroxytryptamine receptor 4-like [Hypomesus transpacificus]|uniref:5-hydroxytryptamine receptor 4-like n=1 Tax=Hypomesus transpacificus TaxID=137520 RepID=UPI001F077152|nr:5-hydroxytryptamine receptor 4-like [Hypomesus transpacificus]
MLCLPAYNNLSDNHSLPLESSSTSLFHSTSARVCITFLLLPIPIFAVLGNLLIAVSVVCFRKLRTPTNAFMVSLAMADFLVAVLVMPFSLARSVDHWHFGRTFCTAHFLLDVTLCTSSIFNLSCVALDRYLAVCDPLHYPARMARRRVILLLLLSWILPLLISSLCVFLGMYSGPAGPGWYCGLHEHKRRQFCLAAFYTPYAVTSSTLSFFIPVGFMIFAYGRIFLAAKRQASWIHAMEHKAGQLHDSRPRHGHQNSMRKARKAAQMLGLIMGVFLLCWLPFFTVNMVHPLWGYSVSPVLLEAFLWLGYANSSLNPFLYASFNRQFRCAFTSILGSAMPGRKLGACLESLRNGREAQATVDPATISN